MHARDHSPPNTFPVASSTLLQRIWSRGISGMRPWPLRCGEAAARVRPEFPTERNHSVNSSPACYCCTHLRSRLFVRHVLSLEMRDFRPPDGVHSQVLFAKAVKFPQTDAQKGILTSYSTMKRLSSHRSQSRLLLKDSSDSSACSSPSSFNVTFCFPWSSPFEPC